MKKQITFEIEVIGPDPLGYYAAGDWSFREPTWRKWLDEVDPYARACAQAVIEYLDSLDTPKPGKVYQVGESRPAGYYVYGDGSHGWHVVQRWSKFQVVYIKPDRTRMTDGAVLAFLHQQITKEV